ncbi:MAG: mismatch repair protein MutS protein [candidate division TM6 bacterium GW2011_GWE2_41_16]|nr:MAG: mismatch repair protein MutS protein [candidate division TM6 bacterium GW2011_GWE2_41_16]
MQQYDDVKAQYPDSLVMFQVGDFYEFFYDDAKKAAAFLAITLTQRGFAGGQPIPLAGVPVHTADHYVLKLVRGGFRVVVCDQVTQPMPGRMIERAVTRVLSPGTLTDVGMLTDKKTSYIAAVHHVNGAYGIVFAEFLTGQVFFTTCPAGAEYLLYAELGRFLPDEIIVGVDAEAMRLKAMLEKSGFFVSTENWQTQTIFTQEDFGTWFDVEPHVRLFVESSQVLREVMGLFFCFIKKQQRAVWSQIRDFHLYAVDDYVVLDAVTQRNLELVANTYDGSEKNTVFEVLDQAMTSMGSRVIKRWLTRPLVRVIDIEHRLDVISFMLSRVVIREECCALLKSLGDFERLIGRIAVRRARVQDFCALKNSLGVLPRIKAVCTRSDQPFLIELAQVLVDVSVLQNFIERALYEQDSSGVTREWLIKPGFNQELDRLRTIVDKGDYLVLDLEKKEQEATGINSLKIRYNKVHGYAIEVTNTHAALVPARYTRLQTLSNKERFTTQELKDIEYDRSRAAVDSVEIEKQLYNQVVAEVYAYLPALKKMSAYVAELDAFLGLSLAAHQQGYTRPVVGQSAELHIHEGRHPVVAAQLRHEFIANDTLLTVREPFWIVTGPNMGGKSTFLRQSALIIILAHMGSFVPASSASMPLVDRIFTRIGASDNVAAGKSTFLVEMEETALICSHATARSFVVLDEVGRGTSTYDGFSLAYAIVEYLYTHVGAKCLFATHYHELAHLAEQYEGIGMYHAVSKRVDGSVLLLHRIERGIAQGSFGIEVAKIAQLPPMVIERAYQMLQSIDTSSHALSVRLNGARVDQQDQSSFTQTCIKDYSQHERIIAALKSVDPNSLSPRTAFDMVWKLCEQAKDL